MARPVSSGNTATTVTNATRPTNAAKPKAASKQSLDPPLVHRFLIVLTGTEPIVWRRIDVPQTYSFWDLHVAIQDAMGWQDRHLHEFRLLDAAGQKVVSIGIPTGEETEARPVIPGWNVPIAQFFERREWHAPPATYAYDFGDDWQHVVVHEGTELAHEARTYPRCASGEGRCPPEDCGGPHGYAEFLLACADPNHEEHASMVQWAGKAFDPQAFDPASVTFDDPKKRWKQAFGR